VIDRAVRSFRSVTIGLTIGSFALAGGCDGGGGPSGSQAHPPAKAVREKMQASTKEYMQKQMQKNMMKKKGAH
jgi:hypothetical protein